ncbi:MAG: hypothetical protein ABW123_25240 [Cystobacter sp.]
MRVLGSMVVGVVALLGAPTLADALPPVNQVSAVFEGCVYSLQSQPYQGTGSRNARPVSYKVILQREQGPYNLCELEPASVQLLDTSEEPELAITANAFDGVVAAYSNNPVTRSRPERRIHILLIDTRPGELRFARRSTLVSSFLSPEGGREFSVVNLDGLTLHSGTLQVRGRLDGNMLATVENPYRGRPETFTGNHFVAIYPDFFTSLQRPVFITH